MKGILSSSSIVFAASSTQVEAYSSSYYLEILILLHMELIEDVKQGLNMIKYLNTHPEEFEDSTTPFFIGLM